MRKSQLAVWLSAATLALAACGDGAVRSPDLPPVQLTGIGQVVCTLPGSNNTLAMGQSGQCAVVGGCQYQGVNADGQAYQTTGVCPDDLTFRSNDPGTVSTTPGGLVTGEKPGATTIVADGGGQTSPPVTVTVNSACAEDGSGTLTLNPSTLMLRSGRTGGTSERIRAELLLSDGSTVQVGALPGMEWVIEENDPVVLTAGDTQLTKNLFTAAANVAEPVVVEVTGTYSGTLLCDGVAPQTKTADVTVSPAQLENGADSICIEATPPAAAFNGCRAVTEPRRSCMTPGQPILLDIGQTRQVQVRGIFDDGMECNITDASDLALNSDNGAVTLDDEGKITGVSATEDASLTATYDSVTKERDVLVPVKQVVGKNGFVVFAKAFVQDYDCNEDASGECRRADSLTLAEAKANKFTCSGPNDLLSLNGGEFATKVFAITAKCDIEMLVTDPDSEDYGKCRAIPEPTEDNPNPTIADASVEAFEQQLQAMTQNVTDGVTPALGQPVNEDGIKWRTTAGRWNLNEHKCDENGADSVLTIGDGNWQKWFGKTERVLVPDPADPSKLLECPQENAAACDGHDPSASFNPLQGNGLAYAPQGVSLGLSCVTAEYTGEDYWDGTTPKDGMTILVPPALATSIFSDSNLCESLSVLVGNPLLGIVDVGGILSGLTGGLTPLFDALDPVTGVVNQAVVQGVVQNLTGALNPLLGPINNALLSPVVDDVLLCNLVNGVGGLVSLLSGNAQPGRTCPSLGGG